MTEVHLEQARVVKHELIGREKQLDLQGHNANPWTRYKNLACAFSLLADALQNDLQNILQSF